MVVVARVDVFLYVIRVADTKDAIVKLISNVISTEFLEQLKQSNMIQTVPLISL